MVEAAILAPEDCVERVAGEVSQSTVACACIVKGSLYAAAGIPVYWAVNLDQEASEVCREPDPDSAALCGASHAEPKRLERAVVVSALHAPRAQLRVPDTLGKATCCLVF